MKFDFKNQRILITQPLVHGINGSTLVTLELANFLQSRGAKVKVYTYTLDNPAKSLYEKRNIHVDSAQQNPDYKLSDFDYIWINSQTLPESLVRDLGQKHTRMPRFIFLHMSSMDWIPDEHPYIFGLEEKLACKTLYICEEVRKSNLDYFNKEPDYAYFRNPAPMNFLREKTNRKTSLKQILFVSNYLPEELREAKTLLEQKGVSVKILGENEDEYTLLDESILSKYDAVVSIAKTVHYCLVHNTPVYVYGKFGGCGWLNSDNYERAKETNFCGSYGFNNKTTKKIIEEIEGGFLDAQEYQNRNLQSFQQEFLISNVIENIFANCRLPKPVHFSKSYINALSSAQQFAAVRFGEWSNVWKLVNDIRDRDNDIMRKDKYINDLKRQIKNKNDILNSRSVKAWLKINRALRRK